MVSFIYSEKCETQSDNSLQLVTYHHNSGNNIVLLETPKSMYA